LSCEASVAELIVDCGSELAIATVSTCGVVTKRQCVYGWCGANRIKTAIEWFASSLGFAKSSRALDAKMAVTSWWMQRLPHAAGIAADGTANKLVDVRRRRQACKRA
jgi:hypothetical protein